MIEAIRNALAVRTLKKAGIFVEMRYVDRGGVPQTRFTVRHHGVVSVIGRSSAVALAKTMMRFAFEDELKELVWSE